MDTVEIRVKGQLGRTWSSWLGGLSVRHTSEGDTIISGPLRDQSALYGVLERLSSLGIRLLSVSSRPGPEREGSKM